MRFGLLYAVLAGALAISSAAGAAIYAPEQQLPPTTISGFKTDPGELLRLYPDGGTELSQRVRDLVASDPTTLPAIVDLLKTASPGIQTRALMTGLVDAAKLANQTAANRPFATEIAETVDRRAGKDASNLFAELMGDAPIGAGAGAGGGGGGGSSGGGGPTGSNSFASGGSSGSAQVFGASSRTNSGPTAGTTGFGSAGTGAGASASVSAR